MVTDKQLRDIGEAVAAAAYDRFAICGAEDDFCIQSTGGTNTVFGGTNRVLFNPSFGFRPDRSYCTERFLREWDAHYG